MSSLFQFNLEKVHFYRCRSIYKYIYLTLSCSRCHSPALSQSHSLSQSRSLSMFHSRFISENGSPQGPIFLIGNLRPRPRPRPYPHLQMAGTRSRMGVNSPHGGEDREPPPALPRPRCQPYFGH